VKILIVAPLWFPIARNAHGGIETLLSTLIAALERAGCRTTLIAAGDSHTAARLVPAAPRNLYDEMVAGVAAEYAYYEQHQLRLVLEHAADHDLIHSHVGPGALALSGVPGLRVVHTWHSAITPDLAWFVRTHPDVVMTTVSVYQAHALRRRGAEAFATIHNGVDMAAFESRAAPGDDLLFIGRIEPEKGVDVAVQAARTLGRGLILAGPVIDRQRFDVDVAPFLSERIRYVGVVDHARKVELFARAAAVVMPSRVDEACPMVCIEALACGTPVVGSTRGALPELIEPGVTGYLADDAAAVAEGIDAATRLDRAAIRGRAGERFDINAVAARYLALYSALRDRDRGAPVAAGTSEAV
jgi:glycosyltransferase involved in cell wall biosynthesis